MPPKLPHAELLSAMPNPLETLWNAWYWTRDPNQLLAFHQGAITNTAHSMRLVRHALNMLKEHVPITEGIMLMWGLSNIPRSLQEQIVRTRNAAFFCETHRVIDKSHFAEDRDYFPLPPMNSAMLNEISTTYQLAMDRAQDAYARLVQNGVPTEIARGVLPMHVNSRLIMFIDLREFTRLMQMRTCRIAQGDYWKPLMSKMEMELFGYFNKWGDHAGQITNHIFGPPCRDSKVCIMPGEAEDRLAGKSPYPACDLYTEEVRAHSRS